MLDVRVVAGYIMIHVARARDTGEFDTKLISERRSIAHVIAELFIRKTNFRLHRLVCISSPTHSSCKQERTRRCRRTTRRKKKRRVKKRERKIRRLRERG